MVEGEALVLGFEKVRVGRREGFRVCRVSLVRSGALNSEMVLRGSFVGGGFVAERWS